jgi:hypothetical protein
LEVSPSVRIEGRPHVPTHASIDGPGAVQHIWMTPTEAAWRSMHPAHQLGRGNRKTERRVPVGDFFAAGGESMRRSRRWRSASIRGALQLLLADAVSQSVAASRWRIATPKRWCCTTRSTTRSMPVPEDAAYFHAQFRRREPAAVQGGCTRSSMACAAQGTTSARTWRGE